MLVAVRSLFLPKQRETAAVVRRVRATAAVVRRSSCRSALVVGRVGGRVVVVLLVVYR